MTTDYFSKYGNFAMIPVDVLRDSEISARAKALYAFVWDYANRSSSFAHPSRKTLAVDLGVSVASVDRLVKELVDAKCLRIDARYTPEGDRTSNGYTILVREGVLTSDEGGRVSFEERVAPGEIQEPEPLNQNHFEPEETLEGVLIAADDESLSIDALFEQCWQLWPRKDAKATARRAWPRAVKKLGAGNMLAEVERYSWWASKYREKRTTLHFATWLNQERWTDELAVESTTGPQNAFDRGAEIDSRVLGLLNRPTATEQRELER
jgi:hypothetical protein